MSKVSAQSVLEYLSKFISDFGNEKINNLWENEEKEKLEKMLKKLVSNTKKSIKPKKVKDPEAPKKKSAWLLFCEKERKKIVEEIKQGKIEKIPPKMMFAELGKRWKNVEEEEKKEFDEAAAKEKEEYLEKKKNYVPKEGTTKKKKKDKNAPKGARSAWIFL